eukprot:GDKI01033116.1.p1 GENE.GDKI01033116.1~~GDKI01033116.1.p1  ORF type:complete len:136 (+),score=52.77 GDKI01033116.1:56-463(+)
MCTCVGGVGGNVFVNGDTCKNFGGYPNNAVFDKTGAEVTLCLRFFEEKIDDEYSRVRARALVSSHGVYGGVGTLTLTVENTGAVYTISGVPTHVCEQKKVQRGGDYTALEYCANVLVGWNACVRMVGCEVECVDV